MSRWYVVRFSWDEGKIIPGSEERVAGPFESRDHALWVADVKMRNLNAELRDCDDCPYSFDLEAVN